MTDTPTSKQSSTVDAEPHAADQDTTTVVTDDGARLHVEQDGSADAPITLVFAHGWTMSTRCWGPLFAALRSGGPAADRDAVRLARYDQRGHGRSTRGANSPASIDRLGLDLDAVLTAIRPQGRVVLAGHSMGGMTIMALAALRPELFGERITAAALLGTSAGGLRRPDARTQRALAWSLKAPRLLDLVRRAYPATRPRFQRMVRRSNFGPHAAPELVRRAAEIFQGTPSRTVLEYFPALMAHDKSADLAALGTIPVSIVVGGQDRLTSVRHSKRLAELLPGAELHIEPDTGHLLIMERPRVVADRLGELLTRQANQAGS